MIALPELPLRVARLPKSDRGYPVPWFVAWINGEPDFRAIAPGRIWTAISHSRCWICGITLGVHRVYVIGPMCAVNRVTSEPGCHRECAEFAATACPFLTNPRQKRDKKEMPEGGTTAGIALDRNPGAVALYETRTAEPFRAGDGILFRLGPPDRVDWYARGRRATLSEIMESIDSGYPLLMDMAMKEGRESVLMLERQRVAALKLLPAA